MNASLAVIENLWSEYFPEYPAEYSFQDEVFSRTYSNHQIYRRIMYGHLREYCVVDIRDRVAGTGQFHFSQKEKRNGHTKNTWGLPCPVVYAH